MTTQEFEELLDSLVARLCGDVLADPSLQAPRNFENQVRHALLDLAGDLHIDFAPHPHVFPDIVIDEFGIEVKVTNKDSWRSVGNSVFESTRSDAVKHVYVLFGKMGGTPDVKWGRYEECVMHVRTSHVPRFEVEINPERSLFEQFGIGYDEFRALPLHEKMEHIRAYARGRLKPGERLWWLEDVEEAGEPHTLPLQARLYMSLSQPEKRRMRAEAALLNPQVVKPSRSKKKYDDAVLYLLTYHGVLCPQARDLFSAGSVALRADGARGGNYLLRALLDIQDEMRHAAETLPDALFVEYWGFSCPPPNRIREWLRQADDLAAGVWRPSSHLFR
jgi:hypothetical protein